jgi:hypothetical protein
VKQFLPVPRLTKARLVVIALAAALLSTASPAQAGYLNLTTSGATGTFNDAIFTQGATLSGTGVFPAFVQIGGNDPVTQAYNTTENNVNNNGSSNTFNHEIRVSDLATKTVGTTTYYMFLLDVNESNAKAGDKYISLDALQVITSTTANQNSTPLPSGTTRYDMGAGNGVLLNFELEPGSGRADMELLIPVANFAGALSTDFVYLYSKFGVLGEQSAGNSFGAPPGDYGNSDGFEEWAITTALAPPEVPAPASLVLFAIGGGCCFGVYRRRKLQVA